MLKKILVLLLSLFILLSLVGCNDTDELLSESFSAEAFFNVTEGASLSDAEIKAVISKIPSEQYEAYPDTHRIPLSATLYKDGEAVSIDADDARLIALVNFFNNCVYYSKCAYTQGLLPLDYIEDNVTGSAFRIELKYTPYGDEAPSPYGKCTSGSDTIVITNSGFTLIAQDFPGYEGREERYPFCAVGYDPLYASYQWLDLFGF